MSDVSTASLSTKNHTSLLFSAVYCCLCAEMTVLKIVRLPFKKSIF